MTAPTTQEQSKDARDRVHEGAVVELAADGAVDPARFVDVLEGGGIVCLPGFPFLVRDGEMRFLDPAISDGRSKNVSYDPKTGRCGGTVLDGAAREELARFMARYADWSVELLRRFAPGWSPGLARGRTSLRPCEIEGRSSSRRKDDTRLHVDAFPSQPVQGRRILRVFANVNPAGAPRIWNMGEDPFPVFARRYVARIRPALPGSAWWLARLGITKGRRTAYDSAMLQLHDLGKEDDAYQRDTRHQTIAFPSGMTWLVFTDAVLHAALGGSHALEQTFFLDVAAMARPERAPLRVLEGLTGRRLV